MPRRDGTGLTGKGPMAETCSGSCTLYILDNRMEQSGVLLVRPDDRSRMAESRKEERRNPTCRVLTEQYQVEQAP
ncbi:MAG TPA: hypothetical protein DCP92_03860 [Nitrospiraceae bacterium]|jgi:hypothetical protein|nr:hypothetical protein [Nitrospiraceae bacterium]